MKNLQRKWVVNLMVPGLLVLAMGCGSKKIKLVARVGNDLISVADFEKEFIAAKPVYLIKNAKMKEKQKFLNKMIEKSLQRQAALQMSLDKTPEIKEKIKRVKDQTIYNAVLDERIVFKVVREEEIRKYYQRSGAEVHIRHIFLEVPPNASRDKIDSTRSNAEEIIRRLRSGADFAEMAKKYSDDKVTRDKGGDMGYIRWGGMDDSFLDAAYKLRKYELSAKPVRTSKGFNVIQVLERRKMPQKPYQYEKENIVQNHFYRKYRKDLVALFGEFNKKMTKEQHVVIHEENFAKVLAYLKKSAPDSLFRITAARKSGDFSWVDPEINKIPLATYDGGFSSLSDVFKFAALQYNLMPIRRKPQLKDLVKNEIQLHLTIAMGLKSGYIDRQPYKNQFAKRVEKILTTAIHNREVNLKVDLSEETLKQYYINNTKFFLSPAKAEVQEILVTDENLADRIAKWAKAGKNFDTLAEKYNTRSTTKAKKGILGKINAKSYGALGKNALEMKVGEIRGPIKSGGNYSIIKVLSREEEKVKTFKEAKSAVMGRYRKENLDKLNKEWMARLRKQIPVQTYPKALETALHGIDW